MLVKLLAIRYSRTQNFHDEERYKPFVFVSRGFAGIHGQQTLNKASRRKIFVQKHKIGQNNYYFTAIRDNDMFFFFQNKIQNIVHFIQTSENKYYPNNL